MQYAHKKRCENVTTAIKFAALSIAPQRMRALQSTWSKWRRTLEGRTIFLAVFARTTRISSVSTVENDGGTQEDYTFVSWTTFPIEEREGNSADVEVQFDP